MTAPRPSTDLTARARIRDAALIEFAEHGVGRATIRGIAQRAGTSPALVQHHYTTKEGLRIACDEHVRVYLRETAEAGIEDGRVEDGAFIAGLHRSAPPVLRYLARALVDGSASAAAIFDELVALTEAYLLDPPGHSDRHTRAVVYTAMRLGVTVLHAHVSRGLGADVFGSASRVGRATLDLTNPAVVPDGLAERVDHGFNELEGEQTS